MNAINKKIGEDIKYLMELIKKLPDSDKKDSFNELLDRLTYLNEKFCDQKMLLEENPDNKVAEFKYHKILSVMVDTIVELCTVYDEWTDGKVSKKPKGAILYKISLIAVIGLFIFSTGYYFGFSTGMEKLQEYRNNEKDRIENEIDWKKAIEEMKKMRSRDGDSLS